MKFAKWYSTSMTTQGRWPAAFRAIPARNGRNIWPDVLTTSSSPAWRKEEHSLILVPSRGSDQDERKQVFAGIASRICPKCRRTRMSHLFGICSEHARAHPDHGPRGLFLFVAATLPCRATRSILVRHSAESCLFCSLSFGTVIVFGLRGHASRCHPKSRNQHQPGGARAPNSGSRSSGLVLRH